MSFIKKYSLICEDVFIIFKSQAELKAYRIDFDGIWR